MQWSEIKTVFENEILCPSLRGRVEFEYTDYPNEIDDPDAQNLKLRDNCLSIYVDGKLFYKFDTKDYTKQFGTMSGHLRHTIQNILSESYMSKSKAFDASWDIANEFIPWFTGQKGIMRAEHAVRIMEQYINNPKYDLCWGNDFSFLLVYLSKYMNSEVVLENEKLLKQGDRKEWLYPFFELRIEAEKIYAKTLQKN